MSARCERASCHTANPELDSQRGDASHAVTVNIVLLGSVVDLDTWNEACHFSHRPPYDAEYFRMRHRGDVRVLLGCVFGTH